MKILYIGATDALAKEFLERMGKEDYEIFFLAQNNFSQKDRKGMAYKYYHLSENMESIFQILKSVRPEYIVYSGEEYMSENWTVKDNTLLTNLNRILESCTNLNLCKILFLSSFEVYGDQTGTIDEESIVSPSSARGIIEAEAEYLLRLYNVRNMSVSIIRAPFVYAKECSNNKNDFLSNMYQLVSNNTDINLKRNQTLYPIHVGDLVDAVKRVIENNVSGSYNVASSFGITTERIVQLISECLGRTIDTNVLLEQEECQYNTSKATSQLEWTDFKKLEDLLTNKQIKFTQDKITEKKVSAKRISTELRKSIENIVIFMVFFVAYFYCEDHSLFSQINWMLIYVSIISLTMGIRQSALSIVLASFASFVVLDLSIFEMTNFYSYAEILLMIIQYVFFGISISYSSDMIKEKLRESERKEEMVEEELDELKQINDQNLKIKNEYEKRILDSKMSVTQLYSIAKKIMVLNPERIFMEVLQVISDVIDTQTVAIYMKNGENPHLRLLNFLNEESTMGGKSWNISNHLLMQDALEKDKIYHGNVWDGEPAVVVPITRQEKGVVVLVIKKLGYEQQSLYYMNLLKTLLVLIKDAVDKALIYENLVKTERNWEDTGILVFKEFSGLIELEKEKQEKHNAEYSIIEIETNGDLRQTYYKADRFFRTTDYFGTDNKGKLFVLLTNTGKLESEVVLQRLGKEGIIAWGSSLFDERV